MAVVEMEAGATGEVEREVGQCWQWATRATAQTHGSARASQPGCMHPSHSTLPAQHQHQHPILLHRQRLTGSQVRMRGEAVTLTAEHDDGEHDHGDHREHDGGEHGDGDTVTAHREPQKPPPIPRLRWPPNGCGVATAAHNDA